MGVDKPDIRVVVHADIPGSLENYLQEAGRAGRDGGPARCVLLFDEADVETQFRLSAGSQLTLRDFSGLLKGIRRRVDRFRSPEIVVSAKELLLDSDNTDIEIDRPDADTKVTTAVAWLERSGFLLRNENRSRVFPASLRVRTLQEAIDRIRAANLKDGARVQYEAVASALFRSVLAEGVSTDELMLDAGIQPNDCFRILHALETLGILANDLGLKAAVSKGVTGASDLELTRLDRSGAGTAVADVGAGAGRRQRRPATATRHPRGVFGAAAPAGAARGRHDDASRPGAQVPALAGRELWVRHRQAQHAAGAQRRRGQPARHPLPTLVADPRDLRQAAGASRRWCWQRCWTRCPAGTRQSNFIIECKAKELLEAIESDIDLASTVTDPAAGPRARPALHARERHLAARQGSCGVPCRHDDPGQVRGGQAALPEGGLRAAAGALPRAHAADPCDARVRQARCSQDGRGTGADGGLFQLAAPALHQGVLQGAPGAAGAGNHRRVLPTHRRRAAAPRPAGPGRHARSGQPSRPGRSGLRQDARHRASHRLPAAGPSRRRRAHHRPRLQPQCGDGAAPAPDRPRRRRRPRSDGADLPRHGAAADGHQPGGRRPRRVPRSISTS